MEIMEHPVACQPVVSLQPVQLERNIDREEDQIIHTFMEEGCSCTLSCSNYITEAHYSSIRNDCPGLDRHSMDMVLLGSIMDHKSTSAEVKSTHHVHSIRKKPRTTNYHEGQQVSNFSQLITLLCACRSVEKPTSFYTPLGSRGLTMSGITMRKE